MGSYIVDSAQNKRTCINFVKISVKLRLLGTQRQSKEDAKNSEHFCKEAPSRSECLAVVGAGKLGDTRRTGRGATGGGGIHNKCSHDNNDGTKCSFTEQLIMSPYADT